MDFVGLARIRAHCSGGQCDVKETFHVFDREGLGYISKEDLHHILTLLTDKSTVTPADVEKMVKKADVNGDGKITYEKFAEIVDEVG